MPGPRSPCAFVSDREELPGVGEHQTALDQQADAPPDRQRADLDPARQLHGPHRCQSKRGQDLPVEVVEDHGVGCKLAALRGQRPTPSWNAHRADRQSLRGQLAKPRRGPALGESGQFAETRHAGVGVTGERLIAWRLPPAYAPRRPADSGSGHALVLNEKRVSWPQVAVVVISRGRLLIICPRGHSPLAKHHATRNTEIRRVRPWRRG